MNERFWLWFFGKVVLEEKVILPNLGTFSVCYAARKTYQIKEPVRERRPQMSYDDEGGYYYDGHQYMNVVQGRTYTLAPRMRIRFRPTGTFRADLKQVITERKRPPMDAKNNRWGGGRSPATDVLVWGIKVNDPTKLSLHRRLIWSYHKEKSLPLIEAATEVSNALRHFATGLLGTSKYGTVEPGVAHLTPDIFASVVYGRPAKTKANHQRGPVQNHFCWGKNGGTLRIHRWRVRLTVPQYLLVSILAKQNL